MISAGAWCGSACFTETEPFHRRAYLGPMARSWASLLRRWRRAGLLDAATAAAIERWEESQPRPPRLVTPARLVVGLGAVTLAAGLLLLVATHWEALEPAHRFGLLLLLVVGLHSLAVISPPIQSRALHGVGTVALGAGILLAGQIFHLEALWPRGLLLWSIGALIGWLLLRQWPQLALLALLGPAWLESEWLLACERLTSEGTTDPALSLVPLAGLLLLSLTYFSAPTTAGPLLSPLRRVLLWLGGVALLPASGLWTLATIENASAAGDGLPLVLRAWGWSISLGMPLLLGLWLRGAACWPLIAAVGWMLAALWLQGTEPSVFTYGWNALGGLLLAAWGVVDRRAERINMGCTVLLLTLLVFYSAEVMDRLGRSLSLIGLGLLCLVGGWGLERLRRHLLADTRQHSADPGSGGAHPP